MNIVYKCEWWGKSKLGGTICDYCGNQIDEFPCAVLMGMNGSNPHALCKKCRVSSEIHEGDNEYFETYAYQAELEGPKPGINFGGRRK